MTDHNEKIDALILSVAGKPWIKTAMMISKIFDNPALPAELKDKENLGQIIAERIYILVDNGRLEAKGNMRRWRDSELRLVQKNF